MDVLSDLLLHLNLACELLPLPRCFAPWGLEQGPSPEAVFYLILGGVACLSVRGQPQPIELHTGDFVLLPHGDAHSLSDAPESPRQSAEALLADRTPEAVAEMRLGGDGRETLLITGRYRFSRHGVHPLLSQLPPVLHVSCGEGWRAMPLEHGVQLLSAELASARPGSREIVERLLEVLFLQAVRGTIEDGRGACAGWLRALGDERIARALGCIHGEPARAWSTASLAEHVGMSRTAFAAQFTAMVGEPPPNYLTRWRIQASLQMLRAPRRPLGEVARAVGYPSTAAFTRIFKRMVGMPPAQYRRVALQGQEPQLNAHRRPGSQPPAFATARSRSA
ncbi:MAG TPA: AraC family transcriptional regulator [bacterium]|nr:AraC family transcriptional regulator [bacterium]